MKWTVVFHEEFEPEFDKLPAEVQDELYAEAGFVEKFGPETGRPHVDKLHGSDYANMKELRFEAVGGEWRVAFAFDPKRQAVLLVAGDKTGGSEKKFYKRLIDKADARFERHLEKLKAEDRKKGERKKP
ncbi:MAG TPA: type II toxin-antitoxin system RelE/ParE family toxin [Acidobacteriaceae bacterium]|jgi:hypothetical protein